MADILSDGVFTVAKEQGPARLSAPFPEVNSRYVLEQDYMQDFDSYSPLALNTAHPTLATYKLVQETQLQDAGCGVAMWTRVYAQVPATRTRIEGTTNYHFIGFGGLVFTGINVDLPSVDGRPRFNRVVPLQVVRNYYLVGAGGSYATDDLIPVIPAQEYYEGTPSNPMDYLTNNPPFAFATTPTRDDYQDMIDDEEWIAAEASSVTSWMGNIYVQETRYVKAL